MTGSSRVAITADVVKEIEAYLELDGRRAGQVYRLRRKGLHESEIATRLGVRTHRFVWNQDRLAACLLEGDVPMAAPTLAKTFAGTVATMLKSTQWSPEARGYLMRLRQELLRQS